jgi:large subunit ribosomal protein L5
MTVSIKEKFNKKTVEEMIREFGMKNCMQVPRVAKTVVNVGIGKFTKDKNQVDEVKESIRLITGQAPVLTKAKQSISGFKVRQGMEVGVKVTLRGARMWDFIEKLVSAAIPRIKDFRGLNARNVDERGNLNLGLKEHMIFPEIIPEQVKNVFGLQITIVTTAKNKEQGLKFFKAMGFPIKNE